jgi:hypothetical protein
MINVKMYRAVLRNPCWNLNRLRDLGLAADVDQIM